MQLEPALDLLIQTMGDNLEDRPSWQFSRSVADITLDFLYTLLHRAIELSTAAKITGKGQEFQVAIDRILYFVGKVRLCVRRINKVSVMKRPAEVIEQNRKEGEDRTLFSTADTEVWACVVGSMKGNCLFCILYMFCCLAERLIGITLCSVYMSVRLFVCLVVTFFGCLFFLSKLPQAICMFSIL